MNELEERKKQIEILMKHLPVGLRYEDENNIVEISIDGDTLKQRREFKKDWFVDGVDSVAEAGTVITRKGPEIIAELLEPGVLEIYSNLYSDKPLPDAEISSTLKETILDIETQIQEKSKEYRTTTHHNALMFAANSVKKDLAHEIPSQTITAGQVYKKDELTELTGEQTLGGVQKTFKGIIDKLLGRDKAVGIDSNDQEIDE